MDASSIRARLWRQPARNAAAHHLAQIEATSTPHELAVHTGMVISAATRVGGDVHVVLDRPNAPVAFALIGATPTTMWSLDALTGGSIVAADMFASGSMRLKVRTGGDGGVVLVVTAARTRWLPV